MTRHVVRREIKNRFYLVLTIFDPQYGAYSGDTCYSYSGVKRVIAINGIPCYTAVTFMEGCVKPDLYVAYHCWTKHHLLLSVFCQLHYATKQVIRACIHVKGVVKRS